MDCQCLVGRVRFPFIYLIRTFHNMKAIFGLRDFANTLKKIVLLGRRHPDRIAPSSKYVLCVAAATFSLQSQNMLTKLWI